MSKDRAGQGHNKWVRGDKKSRLCESRCLHPAMNAQIAPGWNEARV